MKRNLFLAIGCACALTFSACGGEEDAIQKTFCERLADIGTISEYECEETVRKLGACSDKYKQGISCLLDNRTQINRALSDFENLKNICPGKYIELGECANKNGGKMSVSDYCNAHKRECGYVTELISSCTDDYGALSCAENYVAFMDCALTNTTLECIDTGYLESSYTAVVKDIIGEYCTLPAIAYQMCIN